MNLDFTYCKGGKLSTCKSCKRFTKELPQEMVMMYIPNDYIKECDLFINNE